VFFTAAFFYARMPGKSPLLLAPAAQDRCKIGLNGIIRLATRSLDDVTMTAL
jgi:hypothetical protein